MIYLKHSQSLLFLDLANFSLVRAHRNTNPCPHTSSPAGVHTHTHTHKCCKQTPKYKYEWSSVLPVMLLVLRKRVLRAKEQLWRHVELLGGSQSLSPSPSSLVFSSGHPRLCRLAAHWLRLDLSDPSASENAHWEPARSV